MIGTLRSISTLRRGSTSIEASDLVADLVFRSFDHHTIQDTEVSRILQSVFMLLGQGRSFVESSAKVSHNWPSEFTACIK